jgi:hypothetical protein
LESAKRDSKVPLSVLAGRQPWPSPGPLGWLLPLALLHVALLTFCLSAPAKREAPSLPSQVRFPLCLGVAAPIRHILITVSHSIARWRWLPRCILRHEPAPQRHQRPLLLDKNPMAASSSKALPRRTATMMGIMRPCGCAEAAVCAAPCRIQGKEEQGRGKTQPQRRGPHSALAIVQGYIAPLVDPWLAVSFCRWRPPRHGEDATAARQASRSSQPKVNFHRVSREPSVRMEHRKKTRRPWKDFRLDATTLFFTITQSKRTPIPHPNQKENKGAFLG